MNDQLTRRQVMAGVLASGGLASLATAADGRGNGSTLFREVSLVDGTGAPARPADVLVAGDRIASVTAPSRDRVPSATRVVEGGGRVLTPGFIDLHTHGDPLRSPYDGFLAMGVTTITLGVDGSGPGTSRNLDTASWRRAVGRTPLDANVALMIGHGTIRRAAKIPDSVRRPSPAQLKRLETELEAEFKAGIFGLSYGLEYVPGIYSEAAEHAVLGRVVARHDGVIMSHMRSEDDDAIEASIDELIASAGQARAHISHLKVVFGRGEARAAALLEFLADKRRQGIDLTADEYPYEAGFTGIAILFPEWALPPTDYAAIVKERRPELRDYLERRMTRRGGPGALLIGTGSHAGKTLDQVAQEAGRHYADVLIDLGPEGGSGAHFTMDKALQDALLLDPLVAFSSDGGPGQRHPRGAGTYAKLVEDYVVRDRKLTLEEMVRKATSYPARILRLHDRGTIRPGAKADLLLFDPARVRSRATYVDPFAKAEGFDLVMVNGRAAYEEGNKVGRPGALLRAR